MATVTHYIRSEYRDDAAQADPDKPQETGPVPDDSLDPWHAESSSAGFHASRRLAGAPKFVPALLPYDEWGDVAAPATYAERTPTASDALHGDVASWYRSLSRQGPSPTQPQLRSHNSSATRHQTSKATTPKPSLSSTSPSIAAPGPSVGPIHATGAPSSSSSSRRQHWNRGGRDWFISRALSQSQSASAPPSPRSSSSTLVDILSRYEPSTTQPLRPPVFLHLGPSNKGWAMLQNQGWTEGEALGAGRNNLSSNDTHAKDTLQTKKKRTKPDYLSPSAPMLPTSSSLEQVTKEEQEEEIIIDDDDDDPIVEVRKKSPVPMIDLTLSDTDDEGDDDDDDEAKDDSPAPTPTTHTDTASPSEHDHDPRAAQTALLTPLPTILKSDRLGIGLKAKTEGPYRSSVKRRDARRNANANAAAEDMRRRVLLGKGHRAFARAERLERERRQNMMAYLSEP